MKNKKKWWIFFSCVLAVLTLLILWCCMLKYNETNSEITVSFDAVSNGYNNFIQCGDIAYADGALFYQRSNAFYTELRKVCNQKDTLLKITSKTVKLYGDGNHLYALCTDRFRTSSYRNVFCQIDTDSGELTELCSYNIRDVYINENIAYLIRIRQEDVTKEDFIEMDLRTYNTHIIGTISDYMLGSYFKDYISEFYAEGTYWKDSSIVPSNAICYENSLEEFWYVSVIEIVRRPAGRIDPLPKQDPEHTGIWRMRKDDRSLQRVSNVPVQEFAVFNDEAIYYVQNGHLRMAKLTE